MRRVEFSECVRTEAPGRLLGPPIAGRAGTRVARVLSNAPQPPSSGRRKPELVRDSGCLCLHGASDVEPVREPPTGPGSGGPGDHPDGVSAHVHAVEGGTGTHARARPSSPARPQSNGPFTGPSRGPRARESAGAVAVLRVGSRAFRGDSPRAARAELARRGRRSALRAWPRARQRGGPRGRPPSGLGSA
jgi:hypothetical protein